MSFKTFLSEKIHSTKIIVEAFDPNKATENGLEFDIMDVGGVEVVITKKKGKLSQKDDESTIIINQKDLIDADSSFCVYNPQINTFAKQNPDNMFFVMGLVVGTIGISWVQFRNLYPVYASFIKQTDGNDFPVEYIVGLDGKKVKVAKWFVKQAPKYMKALWKNRNFIYKNIYEKGLIEDEFELYKFLIRYVDGMSTVKSAFAVQLLSGKLGCIDNINADIYGTPVSISDNNGQIVRPSFSKKDGLTTDILTKKGTSIVKDYIGFLKAIGKVTNSEYSQRLWDDWTQLASAKSLYADTHRHIRFNMVDGRSMIMPTYNGASNTPEYTEFIQNAKKGGVDPYGGVHIGKEHLTLPQISDEIDDSESRIS